MVSQARVPAREPALQTRAARIAERAPDLTIESLSGTTAATYLPWIAPYLYYFDVRPRAWSTGHAAARGALMLVPAGAPTLTRSAAWRRRSRR